MPHGTTIVAARATPDPLLVAFGDFNAVDLARLTGLALQLDFALSRNRYLDWTAVEAAVGQLAARLSARYTTDELARFRFTAIPRGGTIVLGLLSYALGLTPDQLDGPAGIDDPTGEPLVTVVVDDCALTGLRFRQFLSRLDAPEVVFAPLVAPVGLCEAIEAAESRVTCVPGEELHDYAPELYGSDYDRWRSTWATRKRGESYWGGRPDFIGFPWSEPETSFWNPETERMEPGWKLLPGELCLANRTGGSPAGAPVQIADPGPGPVKPLEHVVWAEADDAVLVANMPEGDPGVTGECLRLEDTAADMWLAIVELGSVELAARRLAGRYDVDPALLRRDLASFVSTLQNGGVLSEG